MKKSLLICLLVVVLCVSMLFAACAPSLEAETLEAMKEMLYQMYKDGNPTNTYEVVGLVAAKGEKANVQWSVSVTSGDKNAVKVGSYDEESKKVTIEVDPEPAADVAYTLTATLVSEKGKAYEIDGQPVSISFERSLKAFKINTYAEYLAACQANKGAGSGEQIRIKAYVIGVVCMSSSSKGSLYLQDADGHGYYAYAPVDATKDCTTDEQLRAKWPIGTEVYVTGTVTTYNGQYEFNKNCEVVKTGKTVTDAELPYVDATAAFAAATSNEDTALAEYQNRRVELKGAIVTRISATGTKGTSDYKAYYYFTLPGSEVEFNVYYTIYFIDDATATAVCDKLVVGKQVDLKGIISVYSKDFQVYPDSANSVSNVRDVEYTDAERVAAAKKNLTLDSAITEPKSIDLPATGDLGTTITWAFAEGTTADFITIADGKLTVSALPAATTEVTVIATITSGSVSETKEFKVSVTASFVMSESHAYAGFVNQVKADKKLYLDGGVSGRYLTTTTDASKAVAIYAEAATNGYKLYILDGETKKYITIYSNADNKTSVNYDAAGTTVYVYNPVVNAFTSTFNGSEVYLGTYNTFDTISVSNLSYINAENTGVEQFPLELLPAVDGATYSASLKQVKLEGKVLYLNGEVSGRYLSTTENVAEAIVIYAEKVEGGYKFYKLNGTTKEYITVYSNADGKDSVNYDAAGNTVFNYDPTVNAWVTNFNGKDKYLGTYNTFNTVSVSNLSYINAENTGVEQFPLEYNPVVAGGSDVPPAHECESKCPTCGKCLDKDCTEAACAEKCEGHEPVVGDATTVSNTIAKVADDNSWEDAKIAESFSLDANITVSASCTNPSSYGRNTGKYYINGENWRIYQNENPSVVISAANGVTIVSVKITYASQNTGTLTLAGANVASGAVVTVNAASVTFGVGNTGSATNGQARITAIEVVYVGGAAPAHKCESVCPECGKCLDEDCAEAACADKCEGHAPAAVVINGVNYSEAQAEEALLAIKADDVVVINTNGTIAKEYTFVAANYTIGEGAVLTIQANAVAPAGAKLAVSAGSKIVVGAGATIDLSALTQEDFSTSTEARLVIAADAKVIMPAYTEALWNNKYLNAVIVAMVADSEVGAQLVLGETKLTKTASGWEAEAPVLEDVAVNVTDLVAGQLAANTELVAGSGIYTTTPSKDDGSKLVIDSSKKSIDGFEFTLRLKFGGTMKVADGVVTDGLKLEVKGAATITVYAMSSSSGSDRVLRLATLADDAFTTVGEQTALGASIAKLTYEVSAAGTYYLGSTNSGINVYYVAIAYEKAPVVPAHECESVCPECGKCLDAECTETACAEKCEGHEVAATVTASKTMKELITANGWTDSTTKQSFNLDENVTVKINGGSNSGKAYNGDHIRVYATDTPAGTITISVPEGYQLVSVKISTQTGTYAYLQVAGNSATDLSNTVVEVSGQSVVFNSVKNGSNGKQVRVTAIEVVYVAVAE